MSFSQSNKNLLWIGCLSLFVVPSLSFVASPRNVRRIPMIPFHMAANGDEEELFTYFDPLLSPHAYPDGISPEHKLNKEIIITDEDRETPTRLHKRSTEASEVDPSQVFDPTLSPHTYKDGAPSLIFGDQISAKKKVGILLIDHGSKKQASNDRLQELARFYQQSVDTDNVIVKASHMEIANPSIPEGLKSLLEEGVDEIICHPYFLSPDGRHVSEDIPMIVNGAIKSLNIEVPIITTEPVGANLEFMVQVVRSICEENSKRLGQQKVSKNE